jgi:hypothetical protein
MLKFGFDRAGGFIALDPVSQFGEYAYPSSPYAVAASHDPARVAAEMLSNRIVDSAISRALYAHLAPQLAA